jgi:uncharacterized protein (UPF0335 family)
MADASGIAANQLMAFIERIERLEAEKKAIAGDIKEVKAEAKAMGFDIPTINQLIKLRAMEENERAEREALLDIYKAAIGMLNDTPLGQAALERLTKKSPPSPPSPTPAGDASLPASEPQPSAQATITAEDIQAARDAGREAATSGQPVTSNPFPAGDPRRAAFDEAWCQSAGSDGMDIPEAFRRTQKPKKPKGDGE